MSAAATVLVLLDNAAMQPPPRSSRPDEILAGSDVQAERDTVAMYFVRAAVAKLDAPSSVQVLTEAGIPPDWLSQDQARVPARAFSALWLAVARQLDDEFFGLDSRSMKVGSFALICQAAISCPTLGAALKRTLRGFAVFLSDVSARLVVDGQGARVCVCNRIQDAADRRFADETLLVLVHGLISWLAGRRISIQCLDMAHARPVHAGEYTRMFTEHQRFDAEVTAIWLDPSVLQAPLAQNPQSLAGFLQTAPQSVFLRYRNEDSWTARLRRRMRSEIGAEVWPTFAQIAEELGIAPTTLRRRLEAEGSSFQQIKDRMRSDWAIDRLCHTALSLEQLAAGLGFHDASAFHRAFVRWTGLQPGVYRRKRKDVR